MTYIILDEILRVDLGIPLVPEVTVPRIHIICNKMLACCHDSLVLGVVPALQSVDKSVNVGTEMERVLAGSLLSTAPSWIFERVDIRRPKVCYKVSLSNIIGDLVYGPSPARMSLLKALASVLTTVATAVMSSSSNAAPIRIGWGKLVA